MKSRIVAILIWYCRWRITRIMDKGWVIRQRAMQRKNKLTERMLKVNKRRIYLQRMYDEMNANTEPIESDVEDE